MITFNEAIGIIEKAVTRSPAVFYPPRACIGSILAAPVTAPWDMPLHTNSSMDGYAVRADDTADAGPGSPVRLRMIATIAAGEIPDMVIMPGTCAAIMTGALVPEGADAVVKIEDTERNGDSISIMHPVNRGDYIRKQGEEAGLGTELIPAGMPITAAAAGLAESLGIPELSVYAAPRAALVITGNEIVPPGTPPAPGMIPDAAGPALRAAIEHDGLPVTFCEYARDDTDMLKACIQQALEQADVVLVVGGASMGEFDLVQDVLRTLNVREAFWRAAIKPGKPIWFGMRGPKAVFNLPGNPVSALVTYYLFVRYYCRRVTGWPADQAGLLRLHARLTRAITKDTPRLEFVRGTVRSRTAGYEASPIELRGSGMLSGLATANCLIEFPLDRERLDAWESVVVQMLP